MQEGSAATAASRWLLDTAETADEASTAADVGLHVYDLSQGFIAAHKSAFLGDLAPDEMHSVDGLHHSALVVFGVEHYFEGGIAAAAPGCTRFGPQFVYHQLGRTQKSRMEFQTWLTGAEREAFQLAHYHPLNHNCHSFTRIAATFLLGDVVGERFPIQLTRNLQLACGGACGRLIAPLVARFTGGVQKAVLDQLLHHDEQRRTTEKVVQRIAAETCGAVPPRVTFLFSTGCTEAVGCLDRLASLSRPHEGAAFVCNDYAALSNVKRALLSGSAVGEFDLRRVTTLFETVSASHAVYEWELLLDSWRSLILDRAIQFYFAYSPKLNSAILRCAWSFLDVPDMVKVRFLQTLCNYCATPHGAMVLCDARRVHAFVTVVGMALSHSTCNLVVELGAALANNMSVVMAVMTKTSLDRELKHHGESHAAYRLLTILLYLLTSSSATISEQTKHSLLLALFHLCSSSADLAMYLDDHPLSPGGGVSSLLATVTSQQNRALVQMIATIRDLCVSDVISLVCRESQLGDVEEDAESSTTEYTEGPRNVSLLSYVP